MKVSAVHSKSSFQIQIQIHSELVRAPFKTDTVVVFILKEYYKFTTALILPLQQCQAPISSQDSILNNL